MALSEQAARYARQAEGRVHRSHASWSRRALLGPCTVCSPVSQRPWLGLDRASIDWHYMDGYGWIGSMSLFRLRG